MRSVLLDSGVLMRALGQHPDDPRSKPCRELFDQLLASGTNMLVPAPVLTEFLVDPTAPPFPRVKQLRVVSYDLMCAELFAKRLPQKLVRAKTTGRHMAKYDSLIIICGLRWGATVATSLDKEFLKVAKSVGLQAAWPVELLDAQLDWLDGVDPTQAEKPDETQAEPAEPAEPAETQAEKPDETQAKTDPSVKRDEGESAKPAAATQLAKGAEVVSE